MAGHGEGAPAALVQQDGGTAVHVQPDLGVHVLQHRGLYIRMAEGETVDEARRVQRGDSAPGSGGADAQQPAEEFGGGGGAEHRDALGEPGDGVPAAVDTGEHGLDEHVAHHGFHGATVPWGRPGGAVIVHHRA
ncbi:hypothetical protein SANTM175S_00331 [Streptomyces antimycoticus]